MSNIFRDPCWQLLLCKKLTEKRWHLGSGFLLNLALSLLVLIRVPAFVKIAVSSFNERWFIEQGFGPNHFGFLIGQRNHASQFWLLSRTGALFENSAPFRSLNQKELHACYCHNNVKTLFQGYWLSLPRPSPDLSFGSLLSKLRCGRQVIYRNVRVPHWCRVALKNKNVKR